jgi:hypothetical protein
MRNCSTALQLAAVRNQVYGPGVFNVAASLGKTFNVWPSTG